VAWIKRFLTFHGWQIPASLTETHTNVFLAHLALDGNVAVGTQTQALSAMLFMCKTIWTI
jgi:hypothetical protein